MAVSTLHVVTDRDRRGAQVHAMELAAGLEALGAVAEVVALAPGEHGDLLDIPALGPSRRSPRTFAELRRRAEQYDVVVAHGSATLLACSAALSGTGIPFVYRQISDPVFWAGTWPRRLRVAAMIRRAVRVVSLSEGVADTVAQHYWLERDGIVTIPNAVEGAPWSPPTADERVAARKRLGLAQTEFAMLYLGALVPEKGVDLAIRAVSGLPSGRLIVAGDGLRRSELERLADDLAPGRVIFTGPSDAPRRMIRAADVLVLPSRGGDSMPAVLIEAGLCRVPAVTTPVGAIADVVRHELTGLVVPVGDPEAFTLAVARLYESPAERDRLGKGALDRCRQLYTIEAVAPRWLEVLREVCADVGR